MDLFYKEMPMDRKKHLQSIEEAINELQNLSTRTSAPAKMPYQYIGTIVDNAMLSLTTPSAIIDNSNKRIYHCDNSCLESLIAGIHRCFFQSMHAAVEKGLEEILRENNIALAGSVSLRAKQILENFEDLPKEVKKLIRQVKGFSPTFPDRLETVLSLMECDKAVKDKWRHFFSAFGKLRNKASHGIDMSLTEREKEVLITGGMKAVINEKNSELHANPRMYFQLAKFSLDFFDEVYRGMNKK